MLERLICWLAEGLPMTEARRKVVHLFERAYLVSVLGKHNGRVRRAAAEAGLSLRHFQAVKAKHRL
jgi:hypothetical protein